MKEFRSKRLRVWENISRTMQEFKVLLLGYRSYTALLTQTGTDAPVATVLENTLGGNIVWTRDDVGVYFATLNNTFTENKTWFNVIYNSNSVSTNETVAIYWNTINDIHVQTGIGTTYTDGRLYLNSIEIRVYN